MLLEDGRVDWLETSDEFVSGDTMDPEFVEAFLKDRDIALYLAEVKACTSGMVELRYEVQGHRGESRTATQFESRTS